MGRRPSRIAQSDIDRAVRAYGKSGIQVRVVYNRDGSTMIEPMPMTGDSPGIAEDAPKEVVL